MTTTSKWYAKKPYIHFDLPLSPEDAKAYVSDPNKVARHPFYPLLSYQLITPRIRKSPPGSASPFTTEPKYRPIAYPSHKDGYIFSYYKSILEHPYEDWVNKQGLRDVITAFRSNGENNVTLAKKSFEFIKDNPVCQIVVTDVESFFDNLDHNLLKEIWARFLGKSKLPDDHYSVYKAITRYSTVERHEAYNLFGFRLSGRLSRTNSPRRLCTPKQFRDKVVSRGLIERHVISKGVPQGTSLSPLLSNMYMADLDSAMYAYISSLGGKYWRYCDDILIVVPGTGKTDILRKLDRQLESLKLSRNQAKTTLLGGTDLPTRKQLQYLGFVFNGTDAVIRSSSIHRYHRKLKKAVRKARVLQSIESKRSQTTAPLRKQALYNMYSDKPVRGKRILSRVQNRKYKGNFTHYMDRAAESMGSLRIARQRRKVLKKFRSSVQQ